MQREGEEGLQLQKKQPVGAVRQDRVTGVVGIVGSSSTHSRSYHQQHPPLGTTSSERPY